MEKLIFQNQGIYCIENTVTKEMYIGHSTNLGNRFTKHNSLLKHNKHANKGLQEAVNSYGIEVLEFSVLEYCEQDFLSREQYYINKYNPIYNIYKDVVNYKVPDSMKQQMSVTRKRLYQEGKLAINCAKKIVQTDLEGNFIAEYSSIMETSRSIGLHRTSIQRVLYGKAKQMKGFVFLYKE
jgi:predicted GIY-YIG superfamily endonuclease